MERVLLGSPIYQKPKILSAFLDSLSRLSENTIEVDFVFVDDNIDSESSNLLKQFKAEEENTIIFEGEQKSEYICDDNSTHKWTHNLTLKVAKFKNKIIEYALAENYNYLFLIDSDIVVHPYLIKHLKKQRKMVISEIFWTQWHAGQGYGPNVWLYDQYGLAPLEFGETLSQEETELRSNQFLTKLKIPGVYEVGGLGACTLIDREALQKGVNFKPIKNLTLIGEDRYFCIRAIVLGVNLFVDTHFPAYHIYRENDLDGLPDYLKKCELPLINN